MNDDEATADASSDGQKVSKRDRFRGAISRTKSKFKKPEGKSSEPEYNLPDDVNQFLQAGRSSTSESFNADALPEHPSPRRVPVPRIDVSSSQRWPSQRPIATEESSNFLRPEHQTRSQSQGSLRPRKNRPRNLSVSFIDAPPVVIGEGGDEAETPPIELARSRARSVSPMPSGRGRTGRGDAGSPVRRKPLPAPIKARAHASSPEEFVPGSQPQRVQTGLAQAISPPSKSDLEREFDMSLRPGSASTTVSPVSPESQNSTPANAGQNYNPLSPPAPPAPKGRPPPEPALKPATASQDLRMQFEEGRALREGHHRGLSNTSFVSSEPRGGPDPRNDRARPPQQEPQPDVRQLQQLSLGKGAQEQNNADIFSPTRPDSTTDEEKPGEWI